MLSWCSSSFVLFILVFVHCICNTNLTNYFRVFEIGWWSRQLCTLGQSCHLDVDQRKYCLVQRWSQEGHSFWTWTRSSTGQPVNAVTYGCWRWALLLLSWIIASKTILWSENSCSSVVHLCWNHSRFFILNNIIVN